jgi:hypothetical protein
MKLKKFIGNHSHWTLNKQLVRNLGLTETLVLQHIIDLTESAFKRPEIFQPIGEMSIELGITEYSIKQAIGKLKSLELIYVERKSIGYKNFYSVNSERVLKIINGDESLVSSNQLTSELSPLDVLNSTLGIVDSDSLVDYNPTMGELKTNSQRVENYGTITNNTTNNTDLIIDTNNTCTVTKADLYKLITDLHNSDNIRSVELIMDEFEEIGWDTVYEILEYDSNQKERLKNLVSVKLRII